MSEYFLVSAGHQDVGARLMVSARLVVSARLSRVRVRLVVSARVTLVLELLI